MVTKPVFVAEGQEERQQRRAEHDLGRGQRQEDEEVDRRAAAELVAHQRERHERAQDRGDHVARSATSRLVTNASVSSVTSNGLAQLSSVKPCHFWLRRPAGSLNENSRMIAIGRQQVAERHHGVRAERVVQEAAAELTGRASPRRR